MKYEVVNLEEKVMVGLCKRTKNTAPDMAESINRMWQRLYSENMLDQILHRVNGSTIALYDAYESDANGLYDVTIGTEISDTKDQPKELVVKKIPAGKYAKFEVEGPLSTAIYDFWNKLWKMPLMRNYKGDFEEYLLNDGVNCKVNIYIGIK